MPHRCLDEFGKRLMREVRDQTIADWKKIADGRMKGERAQRLQAIIESLAKDPKKHVGDLVPEIVDSALHHLLRWLEEDDDFRLTAEIGGKSTENLAEESDGLSGELYTDKGWIARFSKPKK